MKFFRTNVKDELGLSDYGKKLELKNVAGVDTSDFTKKIDLVNLKSDINNLDVDKLKNVPSGVSSLKQIN